MRNSEINSNKILIMPASLANKIAAGEVVERPASAVKELVENAIDAEARHITIVLKQSGKKLIQIVDNGEGMNEADLIRAFDRHATSKIKTDDDLNNIDTLGFRGEALPSIASVAQIEIKSRIENNKLGNVLRLEAGKIRSSAKTACPAGTNIIVKNLFYNTPARRNFLRSDTAELQKIILVLKRLFLAYPDISFELISEDEKLFELSSGKIDQRVRDIFGEETYESMIPLNESLGGIELSGYISKPDKVRKSKGNQFIFLNGRPVQDKSLNHAVFQGYGNLISAGEYPIFCLFLEMDTKLVDVNVHPTKMEVRFSNERSLYYFFLSTVRKALNDSGSIPDMKKGDTSEIFMSRFDDKISTQNEDIATEIKNKAKYMATPASSGSQLSLAYFYPQEDEEKPDQALTEIDQTDVEVRFWQIHNRYIFSEIKSGIVLIDQHVAHERILYEKVLNILRDNKKAMSQQLLFPQSITLTVENYVILQDNLKLLEKIGFGIREFSGKTIIIDSIPIDVKVGREAQIILDILDYYRENPLREFDVYQKISAAFACKNAIKSGEQLTQSQMHALVDQLFTCKEPYFCPHGRPVIITMGLEEIDRKFKRIN